MKRKLNKNENIFVYHLNELRIENEHIKSKDSISLSYIKSYGVSIV